MRQRTSNLLYEYWNNVRNGRRAPCRYEIEPAKIAALLPETIIVECDGTTEYRIRLAGTRICDQFGCELRNSGLLDFWTPADREALSSLLHNVTRDGAVAVAHFSAQKEEGRRADFEMTLMPLIHNGKSVNRMLGCITAIDPPFWLGTAQLDHFEIKTVDLVWPDGEPIILKAVQDARSSPPAIRERPRKPASGGDGKPRFKVYQGGLSD